MYGWIRICTHWIQICIHESKYLFVNTNLNSEKVIKSRWTLSGQKYGLASTHTTRYYFYYRSVLGLLLVNSPSANRKIILLSNPFCHIFFAGNPSSLTMGPSIHAVSNKCSFVFSSVFLKLVLRMKCKNSVRMLKLRNC